MTSAHESSKQTEIGQLTRELHSTGAQDQAAVDLLLQRARVYASLGDEAKAKADISQAAALAREHPSEGSVAAVEQAFREISVSDSTHLTGASVVYRVNTVVSSKKSVQEMGDVAETVCTLGERIAHGPRGQSLLTDEQMGQLVDGFHALCSSSGEEQSVLAAAIAGCVRSAVLQMPRDSESALVLVAARIAKAWEHHQASSEFAQRACNWGGASMYTAAAFALSTYNDTVGDVVQRSFDFCVNTMWLVEKTTPEGLRDVVQGILRLLTANRPLFVGVFVACALAVERLLWLLGESQGSTTQSLAMLVGSQLVGAAKDPSNSSKLPGYEEKEVPPLALLMLRQVAVRVLDTRVQSTVQAERARGLRALASLYESGVGSDLVAELWLRDGWVDDLWDQGDVDKEDAQLALLSLADSTSADASVAPAMKHAGNALVQQLVRSRNNQALADLAATVLAKWSGVAAPPATKEPVSTTEDADPIALADLHARRISEITKAGGNDTGALQRAAEALGFLCLHSRVKEHVIQNETVLRGLFASARASPLKFSTVLLVRTLTQYRAVLTEEQKRVRELQQKASGKGPEEDPGDELDKPERVSLRAQAVCRAGAVPLLVSAVQSRTNPSDSLRDAVAETLVALATTPALRGLLVQQGAVRSLLGALTKTNTNNVAWALAKIAISMPPHLAFPNATREIARLVLPLLSEESLLMRFEALLALTNLASAEPGSSGDVRKYLAHDLQGFAPLEMCLLSSHQLVRRAATELVCNLVVEPTVFERFAVGADKGIPPQPEKIVEKEDDSYRSQRLHFLVALADVDDTPTRCAAAGALAVLSSDVRCCRYLFLVHPRASAVLLALVQDDDDDVEAFKHRVAVIWANAAACGDPRVCDKMREQVEIVQSLKAMAENSGSEAPYSAPAKSALKQLN